MDAPSGQTTTAWGDAQGRRRDILASAEQLLSEVGYASLTMRSVAAGAGVSAGTVYQYFAGKDDVFVALTTQRLERLQATLTEVDRSLGIAGVLREILPQITELWQRLGRSTPQWEATVLGEGRRSKSVATSSTAYLRTLETLAATLRDTATAVGQPLIEDPALPHWVWDSLIGLADDLLLGGPQPNGLHPRHLIDFATAAIERSITAQPTA